MPTDETLIIAYVEVNTPADQLVLHREMGDRFVAAVRAKTAGPIDRERTLSRVVTLRKMGRLPRLRRRRS